MSATPTAELAGFIAGLRYEDIPAPVREQVKNYLLDTNSRARSQDARATKCARSKRLPRRSAQAASRA